MLRGDRLVWIARAQRPLLAAGEPQRAQAERPEAVRDGGLGQRRQRAQLAHAEPLEGLDQVARPALVGAEAGGEQGDREGGEEGAQLLLADDRLAARPGAGAAPPGAPRGGVGGEGGGSGADPGGDADRPPRRRQRPGEVPVEPAQAGGAEEGLSGAL